MAQKVKIPQNRNALKLQNYKLYAFLKNDRPDLLDKYWPRQGPVQKVPAGYWNKSRVEEAAKQSESPYDFSNKFPTAYEVARYSGWIVEFREKYWPKAHRIAGYWNKSRVEEAAKQCKTLAEFRKKHRGAYIYIRDNGLVDEFRNKYWPNSRKPNGYWNKSRVEEAAKQCKTLAEFANTFKAAYSLAVKKHYINEFRDKYWPDTMKSRGYWDNQERVEEAAKQCKTLAEFRDRYSTAYCIAIKYKNWLEFREKYW